MEQYTELQDNLITGQADKLKEIIEELLKNGNSPSEIISHGLIEGMTLIGQKWKNGDLFIPEVIAAAQAMGEGMNLLKPLVVGEQSSIYKAKILIGTVQGDIHNIGKDIVSMIIESNGYLVIDLGVDITTEKFIEAVEREKPEILGLSALLTTTMLEMKNVIEALKQNNLREKVKILVGGAPISQEFADTIGADGYAPDAVSAVDKVKQLLGQV